MVMIQHRWCSTANGTGMIAHQPVGTAGFGYDPIFYVPELGKTAAELTREEKHAVSHRGQALKLMLDALRNA